LLLISINFNRKLETEKVILSQLKIKKSMLDYDINDNTLYKNHAIEQYISKGNEMPIIKLKIIK